MSIVLKLTATKQKPVKRGFAHYWSVIMDRAADNLDFGVADIVAKSEAALRDITDFLERLEKAELIERVATQPARWNAKIRQTATPKVRRDGTVISATSKQQCMWNAIRSPNYRTGFTADDIYFWGSTDETVISRDTAKSYIKVLAGAGYLICLKKGGPNKLALWRLDPAMNTGPLPPMILKTKLVFDQNRHQVMGDSVAEEVLA